MLEIGYLWIEVQFLLNGAFHLTNSMGILYHMPFTLQNAQIESHQHLSSQSSKNPVYIFGPWNLR